MAAREATRSGWSNAKGYKGVVLRRTFITKVETLTNLSMIVAGSDEVKTVSRFSTTTTDRYKNRIRNRSTGSLPIFLGRRYTGILDMLSLWRSLFARAGLDVRDTTKPSSPSDRTECRRPSPCPCIHGGPCSAAPRSLDLSRLERSCPSSCPTPCNAHK